MGFMFSMNSRTNEDELRETDLQRKMEKIGNGGEEEMEKKE